jgi:hypothetical protein
VACLVLGSMSTSATPPRLAVTTWPRALRPACTSWGRELGTERLLSDERHLIVDECVRLRGELRLHKSGAHKKTNITAICDQVSQRRDERSPNRISAVQSGDVRALEGFADQ